MPWAVAAAAVAGAATIGGSALSSSASASAAQKAAGQVESAQQQAINFQTNEYDTTQANEQPYISTGNSALYSLASLYGLPGANSGSGPGGTGAAAAFQNYTNQEPYQFSLQQGELAANRGLAAQGLSGSGAQEKTLANYAGGVASQGFNSYIGQLANLAGLGQSAVATVGGQGISASQQIGAALTNSGNAAAAGTVGAANAANQSNASTAGALGNLGNSLNNPNVQSYLNGVVNGGASTTSNTSYSQAVSSPSTTNAILAAPSGSGSSGIIASGG